MIVACGQNSHDHYQNKKTHAYREDIDCTLQFSDPKYHCHTTKHPGADGDHHQRAQFGIKASEKRQGRRKILPQQ